MNRKIIINRFIRPLRIDDRGELVTDEFGGVGLQFHGVEEGVETRWWAVGTFLARDTKFARSTAANVLTKLAQTESLNGVSERLVFGSTTDNLVQEFTDWADAYVTSVEKHGCITALELYRSSHLQKLLEQLVILTCENDIITELHVNLMKSLEGTAKEYDDEANPTG
jgi:hypothetical protein